MNNTFKNIYIAISYFILALSINSCANIGAPDGGPPDKTPPEMQECSIKSRALNFKEKSIEITFNKYMNNSKVVEGAFIAPKAAMDFDWSGKTLEVSFPKGLDTNTAYILTFGSDYSDYLGNKPASSLAIIFSTGSKIDSGYIDGKLVDDNPSGVFIYAYRIDNINPDSLNPELTASKYLTQIGSNGEFKLQALPNGTYRLFAVRDELKDGFINGRDAFSTANYDVKIDSAKPDKKIALKINKPFDFKGPTLYFVESSNPRKFRANFSEDIDSISISKEALTIKDSISGEIAKIFYASLSVKSPKIIEYYTEKLLDTNRTYKFEFNRSASSPIKSIFGLKIQDTNLIQFTKPLANIDTIQAKIIYTPFADSAKSVFIDKEFKFSFSKPLAKLDSSVFQLINQTKKDTIKLNYKQISNSLIAIIEKGFESNTDYLFIARFNGAEDVEGLKFKDTTVKLNFKTEDKRDWGGLTFSLKDDKDRLSSHVVIFKNTDKNRFFTLSLKPEQTKTIDLPAGNYSIEAFADTDNDGKYFYGSIMPFKYAERFIKSSTPLIIKSRWTIDGYIIDFKE